MQTGKASFINGLSTDSTSQLTVNDQQKLVLYGNAVEYAKTNNIQLGQALTPEQVAGLSQPMLWYVEQTVPEPGCAATGNAKCPTVTALMPQVYLPENFTALSAGGQILASNDLSLNFGSTATGGSILNTGSITSGGTLTVNTGTLTNRANVVDVGEIWSYIKDAGYLKTTGTMVQPGGFMSAAAGGLTLNVDQFNQIGGALQLLDPNGQVDQAATQAFIAGVAAQLGDNFVQQTLQNDLHTDFVKQGGSFGIQQVGMIVAAVAMSAVLGPMFSAMVGNLAGATAGTATMMAAAGTTAEGIAIGAGLGNIALSAGLTAMTSSAFTQLATTGSINFGSVVTSGLASAITAGLLNGITYSGDGLGFTTLGGSSNSLSSLAGVNPSYVGGTAANAVATTTEKILTQGAAILGQSVIQAGVQSAIQGGSFLEALKNSGISNLGAALAFQIGEAKVDGVFGEGLSKDILSIGTHAALGCAGSAASGSGCAGGAIGGAASAAFTPDFIKAIDPNGAPLDAGQLAALSMLSSLMGAGLSGAAGADANAGAFWAQNQALNNEAGDDEHVKGASETGGLVHAGSTLVKSVVDGRAVIRNVALGIAEMIVNIPNGGPFAAPGDPGYISLEAMRSGYLTVDPALARDVEFLTTALTFYVALRAGAGNGGTPRSVATPYGDALQSVDAAALVARTQVEQGATLYRIGTLGKSQAAEAQFWSLENPATPGYAARYGIPPENVLKADFIETATLKPGVKFITRPAPAVGTNPGGGIEVVVPPGGVSMKLFRTN